MITTDKVQKALDTKVAIVAIERLLIPLKEKLFKQLSEMSTKETLDYVGEKKVRGLP